MLESNGQYCIIKSIAKEDDTKIQSLIRRSFLILLSLLENDDIDSRENLIKILNVCKRILHKKGYNLSESIPTYNLIMILEELSKSEHKNKKYSKELIEQIYNLYYKFNEAECVKVKDKIKKELTTTKDSNKALFLYNAKKMLDLVTIKNIQIGS
ncbi:MAG: hypothetical protein KKA79_08530 [Nanoarchaeota archaeon]|nr:hypothetical protein [Nanoarchaeota archaeon]MCG2717320.1 hypothetical protein [Nanoarchaeota archaeon]